MSNSDIKIENLSGAFNGYSSGRRSASQKPSKPPPPYSIRFTEKEREILHREAKSRSWAEYIRERVFANHITLRQRGRKDKVNSTAIGKALGALGGSRLASNMNQIAKAVNIGALPVTNELEDDLKEACEDIKLMREALISALGIKVEW